MMAAIPSTAAAEDIAVVGLACLFPGAPDLRTFWQNIVGKVSAITDPPPEAWDERLYYDASSKENDRVYCKKGGYLGPLAFFDPLEHGIMPRAVEGGEPDQWLALRVAREALLDAGLHDGVPSSVRAALILGKGNYANRGTISVVYHGVVVDLALQLLASLHPELTDDDLRLARADLKRHLPRFDAETAPALISNVSVGRVANRLDLVGPSYTIDAACASSLIAVDAAVKGLRHGEYDLALVGGMQVATPAPVLSLFCQLGALSHTERIRPFDKDADGTLLSEGLGMAVLKRRTDAERDGDRVYAVVKATGVASDGRAVSVLAPRVEGEEMALRQAYGESGISPRSVGLVEAHGTATLVGDAIEVEALARVFGERRGLPRCALGSVKSMIGHTMPAAGIAGFIKAALSLYHKVLPPTLGVTEPSPRLQLERTPFYINTETRPWVHGDAAHPRRAGVNAFGFGGINAHVVLEEAPARRDDPSHEDAWESELCLFAGRARSDIVAAVQQVIAAVRQVHTLRLPDIAFSLNDRFDRATSRSVVLAVVATSTDDLVRKLERATSRLSDPACSKIKEIAGIYFFDEQLASQGRLAFLFPGEGAQYVNMLADLCRHFPEVRACFDEMDRHFAHHPRGFVLSDLVFPPPASSDEERRRAEQRLFEMDAAVEAVHTANHALHRLLGEFDVRPDALLGHSSGEHSAMRAAGMLDETAYETRVHELNAIYREAAAEGQVTVDARLIAVGASREGVASACETLGGAVCIAMDNCRHQVVVAAPSSVAEAAQAIFSARGFLYEVLAFNRPCHTPFFADYAERLRDVTGSVIVRPPSVPLYSATTCSPYPTTIDEIRRTAYEHWLRPVEFTGTIERMHTDGVRIFVEVGPRGNLTTFVDDILKGRAYAAIPANVTRRSGITQLHHLLAQLAAHGVPLTTAALHRRRRVHAIDFTKPADPRAPNRPLGRVKIPTGAPQMQLSPETVARLRARSREARPSGEVPAAALPAGAMAVRPGAAETPSADRSDPGLRGESTTAAIAPTVATVAADGITEASRASAVPAAPNDDSPTAAHAVPGGASHVMAAFFGTMERFLAVQHDVVGPLLGVPTNGGAPALHEARSGMLPDIAPAASAESARRPPFVHAIVSHQPGEALTARCTLDTDWCSCLRDHTLGRDVSAGDPALPAFPILPFTVMTEMMAEAGALLVPGLVLIGMRDVRVSRWVALDRGPAEIEIRATRAATGDVAVALVQIEGTSASPVAEGVVLFAAAYAAAPPAEPLELPDGQAYRWPPERLYEEAMFHGPAFRGVVSIDRVGQQGAFATLTIPDRRALLADGPDGLLTDFVLLDLPGQVVGFWAAQFLPEGFLILPYQMEHLTLYGGIRPAGERLTCVARTARIGEDRIRASLDIVGPDGRLWARFEGWEDRRFDVPPAAIQLLLKPAVASLSRPWPVPTDEASERLVGRRLGPDVLSPTWLSNHAGLWSRVLAASVLSRREREEWHALQGPARRRHEWLLGRIAAKDAVREYARRRLGLVLRPADVELVADEHGRPTVQGDWIRRLGHPPLVSISHVDGMAVALAGDGQGLSGLGVDLERLGRLSPATARFAFTERELQFLDDMEAREREAWSLRLWCAKEACAKATGQGLSAGVRAFAVRAMDRQRGAVSIRFEAPNHAPADLLALTAQDGDWITATCATAARENTRT